MVIQIGRTFSELQHLMAKFPPPWSQLNTCHENSPISGVYSNVPRSQILRVANSQNLKRSFILLNHEKK